MSEGKLNFYPRNNELDLYEIDFDKVQTFDDIKTIFKTMDIRFTSQYYRFEDIKPLLKKAGEEE